MTITRTTSNTAEEFVFDEAEANRHGISVIDLDQPQHLMGDPAGPTLPTPTLRRKPGREAQRGGR